MQLPKDYYGVRVTGKGDSYGAIMRRPGTDGPQVTTEAIGLDPKMTAGASDVQKQAFWAAVELVRQGDQAGALALLVKRFGENFGVFFTTVQGYKEA